MADAELSKLKVAELKKMLKDKGLTSGGTKPQLIERLTKASAGLVDTEELNESVLDEDVDEDEEEVSNDNVTLDDSTHADLLSPKESASVTEKAEEKVSPDDGEESVATAAQPVSPVKPSRIEAPIGVKSATASSGDKSLEARAKRFGVTAPEAKKTARAERFGLPQSAKNGDSGDGKKIVAASVTPADVEKLKARADRFGTSVSSTFAKVEYIDRLKARANRFGSTVSPLYAQVAEDERILKRKQRFGAVTSSSVSTDVEAKKSKRAQRFGIE